MEAVARFPSGFLNQLGHDGERLNIGQRKADDLGKFLRLFTVDADLRGEQVFVRLVFPAVEGLKQLVEALACPGVGQLVEKALIGCEELAEHVTTGHFSALQHAEHTKNFLHFIGHVEIAEG